MPFLIALQILGHAFEFIQIDPSLKGVVYLEDDSPEKVRVQWTFPCPIVVRYLPPTAVALSTLNLVTAKFY